jgi:ankyrin repeat protein
MAYTLKYIVSKRSHQHHPNQQQIILTIMEPEPSISIWKAAEQGNVSALNYFIQKQEINQEQQQIDNNTDDETNMARLLNSRDPNTECTLLHLIISNNPNPLQPLKLLLEKGADATARSIYNVQAIHALFLRCTDPLEPLQLLIQYDADPNARDGDGWTPVHYAARFCKSPGPVLKYLVGVGADVNAIDASKKTALFALLANGDHSLTLDWLINTAKANIKVKGEFLDNQTRRTKQGSLVLQAAKYGRLSSLRILISSASAMESLESILTKHELEDAIELVRQQLIKVTKRDNIERLGLMIMILENLIQKLYGRKKIHLSLGGVEEESNGDDVEKQQKLQEIESNMKRRPSLLKRMGNTILWRQQLQK